MVDGSDDEDAQPALVSQPEVKIRTWPMLKLKLPSMSFELFIQDSPFQTELGWPTADIPPLADPSSTVVAPVFQCKLEIVFDSQWTAVSVSMFARIEVDLGVFKMSMNATIGFSVEMRSGQPGSGDAVWCFSLRAHGGMRIEIAGAKFTASWNYAWEGISPYGPPPLAATPPLLQLTGPSD